jgi:broad specificity phosphatase PhoE
MDCNVPLTQKGKTQAKEVGKQLFKQIADDRRRNWLDDDYNDLALFYTPFLRGRDTKDILKKQLGHHKIDHEQECALLHERQWGSLRDTISSDEFDADKHFNFFFRPENGGESFCDCYHRMATFFQMVQLNHKDTDVIVVAHGEAIRCGLMYLLGWTVEQFDNFRNPQNCELLIVEDGVLLTPLRNRNEKVYECP